MTSFPRDGSKNTLEGTVLWMKPSAYVCVHIRYPEAMMTYESSDPLSTEISASSAPLTQRKTGPAKPEDTTSVSEKEMQRLKTAAGLDIERSVRFSLF